MARRLLVLAFPMQVFRSQSRPAPSYVLFHLAWWPLMGLVAAWAGCSSPANDHANRTPDRTIAKNQHLAEPVRSIAAAADATATQMADELPDPTQLWQQVMERYRRSQHYQSHAEWNLQYRINGQLFVETQPATLNYSRSSQRWNASAFGANVYRDQDYLSVRIHEAATNNLDQQVKMIPASQWERVFQDPIARHYLNGITDFPIAQNQQNSPWPSLFFPQLSWLDPEYSGPAYLKDPNWSAAGKAVFRKRDCIILQSGTSQRMVEAWIDPDELEIVRLFLPNAVMDPQLAAAPEVTDLRISLDMTESRWTEQEPVKQMALQDRDQPVQNFVKVPEAFPSPWIGKPSPPIHFTAINRTTPWSLGEQAGHTVAAIFLPVDMQLSQWVRVMDDLRRHSAWDTARLLLAPIGLPDDLPAEFQKAVQSCDYPVIKNAEGAWVELGLKRQPTLVIWDGHGLVQFVGQVTQDSVSERTLACIQRLNQGDSIAAEMLSDYQQFYQRYRDKLVQETISGFPAAYRPRQSKPSVILRTADRRSRVPGSLPEMKPRDVELLDTASAPVTPEQVVFPAPEGWETVATVASPLPLYAQWDTSDPENPLVFLEGYRTLTYVSQAGSRSRSLRLDLPDSVGVSRFLLHPVDQTILAYQPGDTRLFQFDTNGKRLAVLTLDAPIQDLLAGVESPSIWIVHPEKLIHRSLEDQPAVHQSWPIQSLQSVHPFSGSDQKTNQGVGLALTTDGLLIRLKGDGTVQALSAPTSFDYQVGLIAQSDPPRMFSCPQDLMVWQPLVAGKPEPITIKMPRLLDHQSRIVGQHLGDKLLFWTSHQLLIHDLKSAENSQTIADDGSIRHVVSMERKEQPALIAICLNRGQVMIFRSRENRSATRPNDLR